MIIIYNLPILSLAFIKFSIFAITHRPPSPLPSATAGECSSLLGDADHPDHHHLCCPHLGAIASPISTSNILYLKHYLKTTFKHIL